MVREIMVYIFIVIIAALMWFPGFLLACNMITAVSERKPTVSEMLCAALPGVNLGIARKQLYGSAKLVWVTLALLVITVILKAVFFYGFNTSLGILLSLIFTYVFFAMVAVTWIVQGYVLFDIGNLIQSGTVVKILGFIIPPLSCYFLGRDCIPLMRASMAEINKEQEDSYYDEEE